MIRTNSRCKGRGWCVAAAAAFLAAAVVSRSPCRAETIVIVRHGDRDRDKPDQPLLPQGENRAREIGKLLRREHVDRVFFTKDETEKPGDWLRMCQTARGICDGLSSAAADKAAPPSAKEAKAAEGAGPADGPKDKAEALTPQPMPRFGDDPDRTAQWLLGVDGKGHDHVRPEDHTDVVVMHHEAIPDLLDVLVSPDDPKKGPHVKIGREDYDNVFVLAREDDGKRFALVARLSVAPLAAPAPAATQPAPGCDARPAAGDGEKPEKDQSKDQK